MNQINYSNINCSARRNVFVHSLAHMGGGNGGPGPACIPLEPPLHLHQYCLLSSFCSRSIPQSPLSLFFACN